MEVVRIKNSEEIHNQMMEERKHDGRTETVRFPVIWFNEVR